MFNLMKKDREKKDKDEDKEHKRREDRKKCSPEDLDRLEKVRRSYFGRKKRREKEKLSPDLSSSNPVIVGDQGKNEVGHDNLNRNVKDRMSSYSGHSDSSENSLNALTQTPPEELTPKKPPVPPRPQKRGILKGKSSSLNSDVKSLADTEQAFKRNTLPNELIVYKNSIPPSKFSPTDSNSIKSYSGSAGSPTLSKAESPQTPVGESLGGFHRSKTFELDLRLPSLIPLKPPKARALTIFRQVSGDFGFSLRRAAIIERLSGDDLDRRRTIIFAEPSNIGHKNETGLLPGDRLLEVNGVSVEDKTREEIVELVKSSGDRVLLKVQPVPELSELTRRLAIDGRDVDLDETRIKTGTLTRSGSRRFKKDTAKSEDQLATERAWLEAERVWLIHKGGFAGAKQLKAGESGSPLINGQVKVKLDYNGEVISVDEDGVEKANPPQFDRAEDLCQLHFLNECSILHTLRQRYGSNLIHTYAGSSMIIINPLHSLAIYSEKVIQMFKGCKQEDMPPHIYAVAQTAYRNMIATRSNQSIVFSGRSGSGKTTNFRHVLHYLAYVAGSVNKVVTVEKVNAITTLLEAFGNSRTIMNTNATRFTELFSLDFDHTGQITNASIQVLMLEKTRVVRRPEGEPTFHIFYQMLSGVDDKLRKELMLDNLNDSNLFMTPLQRLEDKQKASLAWIRIQGAMELLSIHEDEAKAIWYVLAAIYHLGVAGASKGTGSNRAQFCNPQSAQRAATLLGTTEEELARSIFHPNNSSISARASFRTTSPSEKTNVNDKPADAIEALEGMVIGLYYEAFNALLSLINRQIMSTLRSVSSILVVDSPGFQNPASCGRQTGATFEDLCYNYAHERLQLLFHEHIFIAEQDRYAQEQIECNVEAFQTDSSSPSPMVNLIDKPSQQSLIRSSNLDLRNADQRGLLWLLDEEAIFPGSTDESFLDRLFVHYNERDHKQLLKKGSHPTQFVLQHLMGTNPVTYNASGWLKACRETSVIRAAATLLQESAKETVSKVFLSCRGPITTTISGSVVGIEGTSSLRRASSLRRGYTTSTAGIKRRSICLQVKFQEDGVIETLRRTKLHFVHCVLPQHNAGLCDLKSSLVMPNKITSAEDILLNVPLVRSQLRGAQILNAVRMHKQGFPEHLLFSEFRHRFELLAPVGSRSSSPILDERQAVERILQHLDVDRVNYRLGLSKIFIRHGALSQLEEQRDEKIQGTIIGFQAFCRGYLGRKRLQKLKIQDLAIRCIQRNVRKFLAIRSWPWWRLMVKVLPLLNVHRTEEELRSKEQELTALKTKYERLEREHVEMKHENDKLEAKLSELTADLAEEHSTSTHATEMLEVETSERMKLEKEMKELEGKYFSLRRQHEQIEMEIMETRMLRASEMNGDLTDDETDSSVYKQKYERIHRELEFTKKKLQQQHEDELEKQFVAKKLLDRKLADSLEEVEEHKQAVNQWKRKVQRLTSEINDLKMLLDEQTARNAVLEKKQRKFDSDLASVQDEARQEKQQRERLQREKDQAQGEKYSLEQDLHNVKLELEMKEEKVHALTKELDDLTFDTKGDEEVALLKRAKHELEMKLKEQNEELDDQAGQLQFLEQAKLRLEMSIEQMRKEHKKEMIQKDEENEEVRRNAQKRVKALEEQLETEHDERQMLIREKHELERRIIDLQERPPPPNHDAETVHRLKRDLKRTKALLRDAQTMLEHNREDAPSKVLIRQLKNQLEDAEFAKTAAIKGKQCVELEFQDLQAQFEDLLRIRSELEQKCIALTREKNDLQSQQEENEEEMAEVMKKYKSAVQQQAFLQTQLVDSAAQLSELELERNLLRDQLSDLRGKLEVLEGETIDTQSQRRLEHRIKELESRLELEETTKNRLEVQLHRMKENCDKLNVDYDMMRAREQQVQDANRKLQRQLREFKEDYGELQQRENEFSLKKKELEIALENVEVENHSLKSDLKLAFKRIEDLQVAMTDNLGSDSNASESGSDSDSDSSIETFLRNHHQRPFRSRLGSSASSGSISSQLAIGRTASGCELDSASRTDAGAIPGRSLSPLNPRGSTVIVQQNDLSESAA